MSIGISTHIKRVLITTISRMAGEGSGSLELDERKKRILNAIILNYQKTGEPVGSRTISKDADLKLSPATIRNEMADLEEMGLIVQPHTSAGRIPTDKGYRLYVNSLMQKEQLAAQGLEAEKNELMIKRVDRIEELLIQMARILAANTNYATMITGPKYSQNKVKFIQLSSMGRGKLLATIVLTGNIIKNSILALDTLISEDDILQMNVMLNSNLNGLSISEINLGLITKIKEEAGEHADIAAKVIDAIADAIGSGEGSMPVYTSGTPNIFKYPELTGGDQASELISTLEEKEQLSTIMECDGGCSDRHDIQVYIGDEVPVESMKNCSVITATYELSEGVRGKIGIIGPKRMDYRKVVDTLKNTMSQLDIIFKGEGQQDLQGE